MPKISSHVNNAKHFTFKEVNKNVGIAMIKTNGVRQNVDLTADSSGFGDLYFNALKNIFVKGYTGSYVIKSIPLTERNGKLVASDDELKIEKVDYIDGDDIKVYPHFKDGYAYSIKLVSINKEVDFIVDSRVSAAPHVVLFADNHESILKGSNISDTKFSLGLDKKYKYDVKIMRDGQLLYSNKALFYQCSSKLDLSKMLFSGKVPGSIHTGRYKIRVSAENSEVSQTTFTLDFGAPIPSFILTKEISLDGLLEKNLQVIDVSDVDEQALIMLDNNNHRGIEVKLRNGKKTGYRGFVSLKDEQGVVPVKKLNGPLYIDVTVKDKLGKNHMHKGVVVLKNNNDLPTKVLDLENIKYKVADNSVSVQRGKDNILNAFFYPHLNKSAKWSSVRLSTGKKGKGFVADKLGNFDLQVDARLPVEVELDGKIKEVILPLQHSLLVKVYSDFPAIESKLEFVSFADKKVVLKDIVKQAQTKGSFGLRLLNGDDYPPGTKLSLSVDGKFEEFATISGDRVQFFPFSAEWIEALPDGEQELSMKASYGADFRDTKYNINVIDPFDKLNLRMKKKGVRNIKASDVLVSLQGLYLNGLGDRDPDKYKVSFSYKVAGSKRATERSVDFDKLLKGKAKLDIKGKEKYICSILLEYKASSQFEKSPFTLRKKFILDKRDLFQEYVGNLKFQQASAWPKDLVWDGQLKKRNPIEVWLGEVKSSESFDVSMILVDKDGKAKDVNVTKRHELLSGEFAIKVVLSNFWSGVIAEKATFINIDKDGPKNLPGLDGIAYIKLASNNPVIVLRDTKYGATRKAYIDIQDKRAPHYMNIDRKNARHFKKPGFDVQTTFQADRQMLEISVSEPMVEKEIIQKFWPNLNLIVDGPVYPIKVLRVSQDFSDQDIERVLQGAEYYLIQNDY